MAEYVEFFRHFCVLYKSELTCHFFIAPKNCIFWDASFEPIKKVASLLAQKLHGFNRNPLYRCYTLVLLIPMSSVFYWIPNVVCLEYPEDGPQTDLQSVTRTNCPVSLPGLLWGTSHELGPPKLEARVADVGCNFSSAHWWLYQCSQKS